MNTKLFRVLCAMYELKGAISHGTKDNHLEKDMIESIIVMIKNLRSEIDDD